MCEEFKEQYICNLFLNGPKIKLQGKDGGGEGKWGGEERGENKQENNRTLDHSDNLYVEILSK